MVVGEQGMSTLERPGAPAGERGDRLRLFLISFLLLFFELAVIRWIPANIRIVGYFSNLILVSCFLGFGIGCILRRRRDLFVFYAPSTLLLVLLCRHFSAAGIADPNADAYYFASAGRYRWLVAVPIVFVVNALPFICIGQKLSAQLDRFRSLPGYTVNVAGSLAGTVAFAAVSFLEVRPVWWFVIAFVCAIGFVPRRAVVIAASAGMLGVSVWVVYVEARPYVWSPYYKIEVSSLAPEVAGGRRIVVNHDYHQLVLDLSDRWVDRISSYRGWRLTYDFPYLSMGDMTGRRVLILGAGSGNDVAAALRNGVAHVDAVELDPEIAALGAELHPERPYGDRRVRLLLNDARYVLRKGGEPYDLIVLGWLDSHRLFSSFSNVRQDNFVYTVEAARQMRDLLTEDGVLCLSFYAGKPWIGRKIFRMLSESFGHDPRVFARSEGGYGKDGVIFMIGPGRDAVNALLPVAGFAEVTDEIGAGDGLEPPTDDWPYLYVRGRALAWEYLSMMVVILGLSAIMVGPVIIGRRVAVSEGLHFFLLGAGFLLLEVRNITVLALVFGSTWVTTSIVIAAVLLMILVANAIVERGLVDGRERLTWFLLLGSIVLSLMWREDFVTTADPMLRGLVMAGVVSLTFFFAGVVFARSFSRVRVPSVALGCNVLGAVAGGMLEYVSIATGVSGLAWVALCLYALSLIACRRWLAAPA